MGKVTHGDMASGLMNFIRLSYLKLKLLIIMIMVVAGMTPLTAADQSLVQQWKQGLSGAKLTSYSGSDISSNSTLTVISFCRNGRYSYYKEGSWSAPGAAAGASNSTITGRWDIQQQGSQTMLVYNADGGERGLFPIYLQNNGRVNIGGAAFAAQQGASGC